MVNKVLDNKEGDIKGKLNEFECLEAEGLVLHDLSDEKKFN